MVTHHVGRGQRKATGKCSSHSFEKKSVNPTIPDWMAVAEPSTFCMQERGFLLDGEFPPDGQIPDVVDVGRFPLRLTLLPRTGNVSLLLRHFTLGFRERVLLLFPLPLNRVVRVF